VFEGSTLGDAAIEALNAAGATTIYREKISDAPTG
jgi:hypothetical protein